MSSSPSPSRPSWPARDNRHPAHVGRKLGSFGMFLFLASLAILFAASMLGYLLISYFAHTPREVLGAGGQMIPVESNVPDVHIPALLWASTLLILGSSITMHLAQRAVKRERQAAFRRYMLATLGLAVAFCALQVPALITLLNAHYASLPETRNAAAPVYALAGLVAFLIILHAAHVLGGILPLGYITRRAMNDAYDHEWHEPVNHLTSYWHFLDVVWIIMFTVFLVST
ncbi:MAG: cytochrome c oxidase subunit 3 [Planctomycetota bacterium]